MIEIKKSCVVVGGLVHLESSSFIKENEFWLPLQSSNPSIHE